MVTLFEDQVDAIKDITQCFKDNIRRLILLAETGWGKSIVIAYMASNAVKKNKKVLILTNRTELLDGTSEALQNFKIHPYPINADNRKLNISHDCYIAMSQTMRRRIKDSAYSNWVKTYFDFILIDECHTNEFNWIFEGEHIKHDAYVIGLTATAKRSGKQRQLGEDYQVIVPTLSTEDLIELKRLSSPIYHKVKGFKKTFEPRISFKSGEEDYNEEDVAKLMNVDLLGANLLQSYKQFALGKIAIMFCAGSANVIKACVLLNENGIKARYLISEPKEKEGAELHKKYKRLYSGERKTLIRQWRNKDFDCMVNNSILTTGFDFKQIEIVIINKLTKSINSLKQMCGRGSRIIIGEKESFEMLDMGDNFERLKDWHITRYWSLFHKIGENAPPPQKQCPQCKNFVYAVAKVCKRVNTQTSKICNFTFPTFEKDSIDVEHETIDYKSLKYSDILNKKDRIPFEELELFRKEKGFRYSWLHTVAQETNREDEFLNFTIRTNWINQDKVSQA